MVFMDCLVGYHQSKEAELGWLVSNIDRRLSFPLSIVIEYRFRANVVER
jgi:hypothetical protein